MTEIDCATTWSGASLLVVMLNILKSMDFMKILVKTEDVDLDQRSAAQ